MGIRVSSYSASAEFRFEVIKAQYGQQHFFLPMFFFPILTKGSSNSQRDRLPASRVPLGYKDHVTLNKHAGDSEGAREATTRQPGHIFRSISCLQTVHGSTSSRTVTLTSSFPSRGAIGDLAVPGLEPAGRPQSGLTPSRHLRHAAGGLGKSWLPQPCCRGASGRALPES